MLDLVGDGLSELSLTGSLGLEKLSKGNTGDQNKLCLVSLCINVWNWYVMKMLAFAGNNLREFSFYVNTVILIGFTVVF